MEGPGRSHSQGHGDDGRRGSRGDEPRCGHRREDGHERGWRGRGACADAAPALAPVAGPGGAAPAPPAQPFEEATPERAKPANESPSGGGDSQPAGAKPEATTATAAEAEAPRLAAASATGGGTLRTGGSAVSVAPLVSLDAPSPFAPRSLAGNLRGASRGVVVQVAVRRVTEGRGCGWWSPRAARFTLARRAACRSARWITARTTRIAGGLRWRASFGRALPPGSFSFSIRLLGPDGRPLAFRRV